MGCGSRGGMETPNTFQVGVIKVRSKIHPSTFSWISMHNWDIHHACHALKVVILVNYYHKMNNVSLKNTPTDMPPQPSHYLQQLEGACASTGLCVDVSSGVMI